MVFASDFLKSIEFLACKYVKGEDLAHIIWYLTVDFQNKHFYTNIIATIVTKL